MKLLRNLAVGITMLTAATFAVAQTVYKIESVNSGKVIDVKDYSIADAASIQQWTYNGTTNQQWTLTDAGNGAFLIRNVGSGKLLDIGTGNYVIQMVNNGGASQQWYINDLGGDVKTIVNVNSGMLLDVEGSSLNDGALLQQWPDSGGSNQQWRLIPLVNNPPPAPTISVEGHNSGDSVTTGTSITVHYAATDADSNLTGIRFNIWNSTTGYFDNGGGYISQSGPSGNIVKTFQLDTLGEWYVWTEAQDANGNSASTGAWNQGLKITVSDTIVVAEADIATYSDGLKPLYRLRATFNSDWLFTTDENEKNSAISKGYANEGIACSVPTISAAGTTPLYRYFQVNSGSHYYTTDFGVLGTGRGSYAYEGVAFYVYNSSSVRSNLVPLYRYFHTAAGGGYLTVDYSFLGGGIGYWAGDGTQGYVYAPPATPPTSVSHRVDVRGNRVQLWVLYNGGSALPVEDYNTPTLPSVMTLENIVDSGNSVTWAFQNDIRYIGVAGGTRYRWTKRATFNTATGSWVVQVIEKQVITLIN
jgi:hypothetical protein